MAATIPAEKEIMANVCVEARPKGRPEGSPIQDYVVEDHANHELGTFKTQKELLIAPNRRGTLLSALACGISMARKNRIIGGLRDVDEGKELQALSGLLRDRYAYPEIAMILNQQGLQSGGGQPFFATKTFTQNEHSAFKA
jgi:hypothetical protein